MDRPEFLRACRTPRSLWLVVMGALALFPACGSDSQTARRLPPNPGRRISVPFDALRAQFREPDMIYAPFIFWFWDEPLDPAKMGEMSRVMAGERFNPGYAHARKSMVETPGLPDAEWLGEKWFDSFGAALGEAEPGKGYLGYCDEYWWPSFQANGRILKANPELKAQSLRWEAIDVAGGSEVRVPASFFAVAAERLEPFSADAIRMPSPKMGKWIWHPGGTDAAHSCRFRKTFDLPVSHRVERAAISVIVDDAYVLYLNGKKVGEGDSWQKPGTYDVTALVTPSGNTLAVEGRNVSASFGLLFGMAITLDGGRTIDVRSDRTWLASLEPAAAGGRVYALAGLPSASAEKGMADPEMVRLMDKLRGLQTFAAVGEGGLSALVAQAAPGLDSPVRFASGAFPMLQHRRRIDGRDFFWLANNTDTWQACELEVADVHGAAAVWDCERGDVRTLASVETGDSSRLTLVFKPYEAVWLVFDPNVRALAGPPERRADIEVVATIEGSWKVSFDAKIRPTMEYPSTPPAEFASGVEKPLENWQAWGLPKFSGLLDYVKTVTVDRPAKDIKLDLGKVCHAAEVWVNGKSCGARLWGPHVFDVGEALRPGANEIRVRVANLINNSYGEIAESGLIGPVRLVTGRFGR